MSENRASILLFLTAFIWGMSFVAQSVSSDLVGPFFFNGSRMLLGSLVLLPFVKNSLKDKEYRKKCMRKGIVLAFLLSLASMLQQIGISYSTAGKGGFITSLYVVIVPFILVLRKVKIEKKTWVSAAIALLGMYLLCIKSGFSIGKGDIYLLLCSVFFAFHIIALENYTKDTGAVEMSFFQFLFSSAILLFLFPFFESVDAESIKKASVSIIYAGAFSCGIAYTLQAVSQKYVKSTRATLILSLESVFSAIGGALILGQYMSAREIAGAALVFLAVIISQIRIQIS
ncbi:MAG TPA: DMT family transporter [Candidatus Ornithospirochaeta avicola]|uniref:DMT family transporter n=1 Tax=Candidatus Ornithospirochaeta avicola TaxID=2840896 RepID=A0A9D1TNH6_9SPIO|nr:DMT family transporter [Candidatus Ornithospirochaeta avicola]